MKWKYSDMKLLADEVLKQRLAMSRRAELDDFVISESNELNICEVWQDTSPVYSSGKVGVKTGDVMKRFDVYYENHWVVERAVENAIESDKVMWAVAYEDACREHARKQTKNWERYVRLI